MRLFKPSVRTRFLLTYFLLFTVPLLLVGIVSYRRLTNLVAEKTEGSYQTILSRVAQSVDEQLRGLASFTQQLAQLSWMQKLMYMQEKIVGSDRVDPYALEEYQQQFKAYDSANAFVDDIAVFFSGKDFYISSRGKGNLWWLTNFPFRINGMEEAAWTSLLAEDNQQRILPSISMDTYGIERHGLLYVQAIHSPRFPDNRVRATFLAFIRQGELEQFLQVVHADSGISAWIVDAGGAWLAGDPVLAASAPVAGAASARAQSISDATGRRFFLLQSISDLNGWRYFAAVPREVILRHVDQTGMVVVALMVACGIVGWFLSFGLAAMSYRPVSELMRLMQGHQPAARGRRPADEFEWLQGSVRELLRQETELKCELERDRPAATSLYLGKLLSGSTTSDAEYLKALELLGVRFPHERFSCAVVYPAAWAEDLAGKMSAGVGIVVRSVDMGSHRAVVLNFRTDAELDALVDGMNREWSRRGDERASIGLGSAGAGMGHLPQSYREATYAADYRLVWGSGIVVLFDAVRDADQCYYYPIATENVMINLLGAGERGRATELLSEVMARNLSQPGSPPGAIRNLALNIVLTAAKAAEEIGVGAELRLDTRRIQECGTIDELRGALDQIVTEVCALARRGRHEAPVLDQARVAAFVEENLTNPELSLKMLADWCGISPSYASRCFLELFGVHFLDHVTALRIGKAKAMLEEGMLSIGEVALKVGYSSDVTFRRLFKSHEGFSPSGFQTLRKARTAGAGRI